MWEVGALSYQPTWEVLKPVAVKADNGVTLKVLPDGSVLAGGALPSASIYEVSVETPLFATSPRSDWN